jgi:hypothetical protein
MRFREPPVANARITSFKASSDVLISAPSIRVVRQAIDVSAPRSLPAKSMNVSRPMGGGKATVSRAPNQVRMRMDQCETSI